MNSSTIKNILFLFLVLSISSCSDKLDLGLSGNNDTPDDGPVPSQEWQLVWSDEFDAGSLDATNWEVQQGDGTMVGLTRWGNNEDQYYTDSPDNVRVEVDPNDPNNDGSLVITSLSDGYTTTQADVDDNYTASAGQNFGFTSGRITTRNKFEFTYGKVEARIK